MKYVITGGAGNISKPITEKLLKAGHDVTVIGRNAEKLKGLVDLGAKVAIGSVDDVVFIKKAFAGADAVYTMIPPNFGVTHWKEHIGNIGKIYAEAIKANNIRYVVNLSSIGAHLPEGAGPISGLYRAEQTLNTLENVNIKHLRPAYFFDNLLGTVDMAKHMNIIGSNFGGEGFKMVLTDTNDIADAAVEELLDLKFTGNSVRYIASDERDTAEIAKILGTAIGKPDLPWVVFTDEQSLQGMLQAGLPEEIAKNYTEMGNGLQKGTVQSEYLKNRPSLGKVKLEDFAKKFAAVYNN